jgi:hypothetical protein
MSAIPYPGQPVQFKLDFGPNAGALRPAIVVQVNGTPSTSSKCQLFVMLDGSDYSGSDFANQQFRSEVAQGTSNGTFQIESSIATFAAYAAGTVYSFTNAQAAITFGTTQPAITIAKAGTYRLRARVNVKYNGATFAAPRTLTLKIRRTNNTPGDVTNAITAVVTAIVTTTTGTFLVVDLPDVLYSTSNTDDALTIYGGLDTAPTDGSLDAVEASIIAVPQN